MKKLFIIFLSVMSFVSCKNRAVISEGENASKEVTLEYKSDADIEGIWLLHKKTSKAEVKLLSSSLSNSEVIIITSDGDGLWYTLSVVEEIGDTPAIRELGATLDCRGAPQSSRTDDGLSLREGRGAANDLIFSSNTSPTYFDLAVRKYTEDINAYFNEDDWVITGRYIRVPSIGVNYIHSKHLRELDDHWKSEQVE
ncbi:hypothetical protein HW115_18815 [Verrucomicrobiaceae bacterium N1E253]|uniref:Uncharacterized protein n=1 Tax=Oceaniferula marina TaxID=2748318 RepID=A0A851GRN0_9BACT|nr:hypothetical protein [Oceaniferula marina]NWK57677.1 hypothetical protein [Oceaniferula marina]